MLNGLREVDCCVLNTENIEEGSWVVDTVVVLVLVRKYGSFVVVLCVVVVVVFGVGTVFKLLIIKEVEVVEMSLSSPKLSTKGLRGLKSRRLEKGSCLVSEGRSLMALSLTSRV